MAGVGRSTTNPAKSRQPRPAAGFAISAEDSALVVKIIERVERDRMLARVDGAKLNLRMDLVATHANGCPMDFHKLLHAADVDFYHDIFGIGRHIDRTTGELLNCFVPRSHRQGGAS
jgi:hypothetical protein